MYYSIPTVDKNVTIIISEEDSNKNPNQNLYEQFYSLYSVIIL